MHVKSKDLDISKRGGFCVIIPFVRKSTAMNFTVDSLFKCYTTKRLNTKKVKALTT